MNKDIRKDFLATIMIESDRCVENRDLFDYTVLKEFYGRCNKRENLNISPQNEPSEMLLVNLKDQFVFIK